LTILATCTPVESLHFSIFTGDVARKELHGLRQAQRDERATTGASKRLRKVAEHNQIVKDALAKLEAAAAALQPAPAPAQLSQAELAEALRNA
jgi:hypothetical protein